MKQGDWSARLSAGKNTSWGILSWHKEAQTVASSLKRGHCVVRPMTNFQMGTQQNTEYPKTYLIEPGKLYIVSDTCLYIYHPTNTQAELKQTPGRATQT